MKKKIIVLALSVFVMYGVISCMRIDDGKTDGMSWCGYTLKDKKEQHFFCDRKNDIEYHGCFSNHSFIGNKQYIGILKDENASYYLAIYDALKNSIKKLNELKMYIGEQTVQENADKTAVYYADVFLEGEEEKTAIYKLDLMTNNETVILVTEGYHENFNFSITKDEKCIYYIESLCLKSYNVETKEDTKIKDNINYFDISSEGDYVICERHDHMVSIYDLKNNSEKELLSVKDFSPTIKISPDDKSFVYLKYKKDWFGQISQTVIHIYSIDDEKDKSIYKTRKNEIITGVDW